MNTRQRELAHVTSLLFEGNDYKSVLAEFTTWLIDNPEVCILSMTYQNWPEEDKLYHAFTVSYE